VTAQRWRKRRSKARLSAPTNAIPVTQLALLLALSLIGLVLSFAFGRLEVKRSPISATVKRAEGALERASVTVLRLGATRGLTLLMVPALGLVGLSLLGDASGAVSSGGRAIFLLVALLAGAGLTLVQARFTLGLGTRAASSAAVALARGSARAMRPLIRASIAIAVFGEALGLLGAAAAFASLYAVRGGFAATEPNAALANEVVKLLPAFALGAAVAALVLSREGSVAATAVRVGGTQGTQLDAAGDAGDPRDPALLAGLMGQLVGELLPRALTSYVCGLTVTVSAALLAVSGARAGANTLACLVLVALVRAFGALSSVCGVFAARVTDEEPPSLALWRGLGSAFVVASFGLGAALFWLERPHFAPLFAAGALGLCSMTLVAQAAWLPLRRGAATSRELLEARGSGEAATIVRGAGAGISGVWPALLLPALSLAFLERALSTSTPPGLLLVSFAAGALSLGPFALSMSGFGLLAVHARGVAALARLDVEPRRRELQLDDASALGNAAGSTHASLSLALSSLLGLLSLNGTARASTDGSLGPAALAIGLGVALVLLLGARAAQSAVSGSRLVASEVERQLREFPRQQGVVAVPADFTPSYKACVEAAFSAARGASVVELGALLLAPFVLGSWLRWGSGAALEPTLAGFGIAAVLSGLVLTLGARATRAMLGELRRRLRGGDASLSPATANQAQSFGDLVGVSAASSVEALALVLALTVMCLAPLLR
jgi:H+-translocating diphosphatase